MKKLFCFILATSLLFAQSAREDFLRKFVQAAVERTHHVVRYASAYVAIPYPNGDVPADTGVCSDEVIRSYRAVGIDPQKEAPEEMKNNFAAYQSGLKPNRPAANT